MRASEVSVFDETDFEFIKILRNFNIPRNIALTLVYLSNVEEATSQDLEIGSGLRQPEVSIAMRELKRLGWIDEREVKKEGKGRPTNIYKLTVTMPEIVVRLEKQTVQEAQRTVENIEKLKKLQLNK